METRPMHNVSIYKDLSPEKRSSSTTQLLGNLYAIKLESLNVCCSGMGFWWYLKPLCREGNIFHYFRESTFYFGTYVLDPM